MQKAISDILMNCQRKSFEFLRRLYLLRYYATSNFPKTQNLFELHSVHWGVNPPHSKTPSFLPSPLALNLQTVQTPFLGNPPLYIGFS